MRVVQINTVYGVKSTGRTCSEVERALTHAGHVCYTAYGYGHDDSPFAFRIGTQAEYYIHNLMSRITGLEGYFSRFATWRFLRRLKRIEPDIIHLRNLHGHYLYLPSLFRYLRKANTPVILNLHDCWILTGKCASYTERDCHRWQKECGACPALREYPQSYLFDFTRKMRADKERWLAGVENLTVVGVSDWVAGQARQSFLKDREIARVYNWVDTEVFRPRDMNAFAAYGIDNSKFVILGVSTLWSTDTPRYDDFAKLADMIDERMQIVLIGHAVTPIEHARIVHIPFVDDVEELARLYSAAGVYVHLSTEDAFGKVIAEAMACGTPVVVYDSTACGELVADGCGYVAPARDVAAVWGYIRDIAGHSKEVYREACLDNVSTRFELVTNMESLIATYQHALEWRGSE